jgi:hypothetical protein
MQEPPSPQVSSEIDRLRHAHPLWAIGTIWITAATGSDARRLTATREGIQIHAWTGAELSRKITDEEVANGWPCHVRRPACPPGLMHPAH